MFVIYHKATRAEVCRYKRRGNAERFLATIEGADAFDIVPLADSAEVVKKKSVVDLMSGKLIEID